REALVAVSADGAGPRPDRTVCQPRPLTRDAGPDRDAPRARRPRPAGPDVVDTLEAMPPTTLLLAAPRGFCAGVDRAVLIVEKALEAYGAPVYVRHEIVHNTHVVESLRREGAVFVEDETEVPEGAVIVFSAHGSPPEAF